MSTEPVAKVWSKEEARTRFDELLAAAEKHPQHIEAQGRRFVLSELTAQRQNAKELLRRGGPLEEGDSLG
ncbi:hypothetical protein EJC49_15555 [Aquibium carbonis]|uniref:Antitoxin n=1 Tax=Aquibium carbonis TaxID=2495581 RepID=A0A3S0A5X2_9HYPH|nr:hypothetical protein [Aquibium carbonis]RST85502.1 hypothetical protein EJC49_15555 [Aquibium carbonis]